MQPLRIIGIVFVVLLVASIDLVSLNPQNSSASATSGTIAYVRDAKEIRLIEPDGSNDHSIWTRPKNGSAVRNLAWRPDAGELAFISDHEAACSWFDKDLYTIQPDGSGLHRVTNSPECAKLKSFSKGSVKVEVQNYNLGSDLLQVYVQGAPQVKSVSAPSLTVGTVTLNDVADFGNGVVQPAVVVYGGYRWYGGTAPDVKAGKTTTAGPIAVSGKGSWDYGAESPSWSSDGSNLGYTMSNCSSAYKISPNPKAGELGRQLISSKDIFPCIMAWGPSAGRANQFLYSVGVGLGDYEGIFLATEGKSLPSEPLVKISSLYGGQTVHDLKWLPDGSGFIFAEQYVDHENPGIKSNLFLYDFATDNITQITDYNREDEVIRSFSVSPDGQLAVYELATAMDAKTADLWVVRRDGSNQHLLAKNASDPAWSKVAPHSVKSKSSGLSCRPRLPFK